MIRTRLLAVTFLKIAMTMVAAGHLIGKVDAQVPGAWDPFGSSRPAPIPRGYGAAPLMPTSFDPAQVATPQNDNSSPDARKSSPGNSDINSLLDADDSTGDPESETVVVRDVEKLPKELKEQFAKLPEAERKRIYAAIRDPGVRLPAQLVAATEPANSADAENRRQAMTLLIEFAKIKQLSRSTGDILTARAEPSGPPPLEVLLAGKGAATLQNLPGEIVAGDWTALRKELAPLPAPVNSQMYSMVLGLLAGGGETLAPPDVLAVAEASPTPLDHHQIAILARLLVPALQKVDRPDKFLAELSKGGARLGGADPERRAATARLLIAAKLLDQARGYLIPLDKAINIGDVDQLNLHGLLLLHRALSGADPEAMRRGWELTQLVLKQAPPDSAVYREVFQRAAVLVGQVPAELSGPWLRSVFENDPQQGIRILASIAQRLDGSRDGNQPMVEVMALGSLQAALHELTPIARAKPELWSSSLQLMVLQWASHVQAVAGLIPPGPNDDPNRRQNLLPPLLLMTLGLDEVSLNGVDVDVAWSVRRLEGLLAARAGAKEPAMAAIKAFTAHDPQVARQLAQEFLGGWVARLSSNGASEPIADSSRLTLLGQVNRYNLGGGNGGESVPLTRSRQVRNLTQFRELLGRFAQLGAPPLDADAVVGAFIACHSPAEVYREEDVQRVFGPVASLKADLATKLAAAMRENLGGQWRNLDVQNAQSTHRTEAEIVAEIQRGYELAIGMLQAAAKREPDQPQLLVLLGMIYFDNAEFLYGQHADLKTYVKVRDQAFGSYRLAHEAYAKQLGKLPAAQHTAAIYRQWFQSALGASDLAQVSLKDQPNGDQIKQIAQAIRSLDKAAADEHLQLFAKELGEGMNQVPPHMKPWFMREALRVLGDNESGAPFRQLVDFYHDLLGEIELHVQLDGNRTVGREPFGAQLVIRGTTAVSREAGGFAALLMPGNSAATGEPINRKDKLEKEIREKLSPGFEILQLRFNEQNLVPHTFGREGWRETPLAYVVLKAKDPAIDRIVPLQLDLEFNDGHGIVVLPISSEPQLVDAHSPAAARPLAELKVKQTLDDRKLAENVVRLEVAATGKGLIPDLTHVLKIGSPGGESTVPDFTVTSIADHGLTVSSLSTESGHMQPLCERRWTVDLAPREAARPSKFHFATAATTGTELTYARFDDADLIDAEAVTPLRAWPLATADWLPAALAIGGGAILLIVCLVVFRVVRARRLRNAGAPKYKLPEPVTPFSAVALLKRLDEDASVPWSGAERADLSAEIERVERRYFTRVNLPSENTNGNGNGHDELDTLLRRWLLRASR